MIFRTITRKQIATLVIACLLLVCVAYTILYYAYIKPVCLSFTQTYHVDPVFVGLSYLYGYVVRYLYAALAALILARFLRTEIFYKVPSRWATILFWVMAALFVIYILLLLRTLPFTSWTPGYTSFLWRISHVWQSSGLMFFIFFIMGLIISPFVYKDKKGME